MQRVLVGKVIDLLFKHGSRRLSELRRVCSGWSGLFWKDMDWRWPSELSFVSADGAGLLEAPSLVKDTGSTRSSMLQFSTVAFDGEDSNGHRKNSKEGKDPVVQSESNAVEFDLFRRRLHLLKKEGNASKFLDFLVEWKSRLGPRWEVKYPHLVMRALMDLQKLNEAQVVLDLILKDESLVLNRHFGQSMTMLLCLQKEPHLVAEILPLLERRNVTPHKKIYVLLINFYLSSGDAVSAKETAMLVFAEGLKLHRLKTMEIMDSLGKAKKFTEIGELLHGVDMDGHVWRMALFIFIENGRNAEAEVIMEQMNTRNFSVAKYKCFMIANYGTSGKLDMAEKHFYDNIQSTVSENITIRTYNAMIFAYMVNDRYQDAFNVVQKLKAKNLKLDERLWHLIIRLHIRMGNNHGAVESFKLARNHGIRPNMYILETMLISSMSSDSVNFVKQWYHQMLKLQVPIPERIVAMYVCKMISLFQYKLAQQALAHSPVKLSKEIETAMNVGSWCSQNDAAMVKNAWRDFIADIQEKRKSNYVPLLLVTFGHAFSRLGCDDEIAKVEAVYTMLGLERDKAVINIPNPNQRLRKPIGLQIVRKQDGAKKSTGQKSSS